MYRKFFILTISFVLFPVFSFAAYDSQCQTGQNSGTQSGCTHDNDQKILQEQCMGKYGASSCENMSSYLNAMSVDCAASNPSGVDCSMISQNGIYGREASKFADLQEGTTAKDPTVSSPTITASKGWSLAPIQSLGLPKGSVSGIILNIMYWLLFMLGIVGVIGFVISGIMYLISAGDDTMITRAKKAMTFSIVGIIVGLAGLIIIRAVINILGASSTI
jgi:hypothetical protein